jgi:hypothetical protein
VREVSGGESLKQLWTDLRHALLAFVPFIRNPGDASVKHLGATTIAFHYPSTRQSRPFWPWTSHESDRITNLFAFAPLIMGGRRGRPRQPFHSLCPRGDPNPFFSVVSRCSIVSLKFGRF